ncbi:Heat-labile enterotoxin, A chain [Moelleriella libera RCEF 2490]|uniref:Heat-labile enterotoxin, A chain n=1 Tax=Moelleriella libera RCEF 2490 TaxID=1081109 RepID=A0A166UUP2_9HYPO|nr:Heat-labile enterotoxin, A chain [Moelleriella libera RCEF 2490]
MVSPAALLWSSLLLGLVQCQEHSNVHQVFRSDTREPAVLKARGGILSPAKDLTNASLRQYTLDNPCSRGEKCIDQSYFIRTSKVPVIEEERLGPSPGFLYHIQATPNSIDLATSLGNNLNNDSLDDVVVLGDIRWDQIISWVTLPQGNDTKPEDRQHTRNTGYDSRLGIFAASTHHSQLLGASNSGSPTSPQEAVTNFVRQCASALGWRSVFEPSVKYILRSVQAASDNSIKALQEAKEYNAPSSGTTARMARNQARLAMKLTHQLAAYVHNMAYPDLTVVTSSYKLALIAKSSATRALHESELKFSEAYSEQIKRAKSYVEEGNPGAAVEVHEVAVVTDLAQAVVARAMEALWLIKEDEQEAIDSPDMIRFDANEIACAGMLQHCESARQYRLETFQADVAFMTDIVHNLEKTAAGIRQESEDVKRAASLAENDRKDREQAGAAHPMDGAAEKVRKIMAVEAVTPVLNEARGLVEVVKEIQLLSRAEQELASIVVAHLLQFGLDLLAFVPESETVASRVALWARRVYRFYSVAKKLGTAVKVGNVRGNLSHTFEKMAALRVAAADVLQRIDRPRPRTATIQANMKKNSTTTYFGVFRDLGSQLAGPNWRYELEVTSGLQVEESGKPHENMLVLSEQSGERSKAQILKQIQDMLESARREKNVERSEEAADVALQLFDTLIAGHVVREKTLLDSLDEGFRAGTVAVAMSARSESLTAEHESLQDVSAMKAEALRPIVTEEDEFHHSYVINP